MKNKRIWLYVIITVLFVSSFYVINLKFDKFYRINGINNDNRVVLEQYLDKDEQEYLVENQIDLDLFYQFIKIKDFSLYNYQYYDLLKDNTKLSDKKIISLGNQIQDRLLNVYNKKDIKYAKNIIENHLEYAFLNNDDFDLNYIKYYSVLAAVYDTNDYSYVNDTITYMDIFEQDNIQKSDYETYFTYLVQNYCTKSNVYDFMTHTLLDSEYRVYNPSDLLTLINDNTYIGNYEPDSLIMVNEIKRVKYAIYVTDECNKALANLNKAYNKKYDEKLIIYNGYISSTSINNYNNEYKEFQLGNSVDFSLYLHNYNNFDETDSSSWLEDNAYKYGFILRYPKNKASYTGQSYNSHIYRYVGVEASTEIHDKNISLEEYLNESNE